MPSPSQRAVTLPGRDQLAMKPQGEVSALIDQRGYYVPLIFTLDRNGNVETWKFGVPW